MAKGGSTGWKQKSGAIKSCSAKFVFFFESLQFKIHLIRGATNQSKMKSILRKTRRSIMEQIVEEELDEKNMSAPVEVDIQFPDSRPSAFNAKLFVVAIQETMGSSTKC